MYIDVGAYQPGPDSTLVVGAIALFSIAIEMTSIGGVAGAQRTQTHLREESASYML